MYGISQRFVQIFWFCQDIELLALGLLQTIEPLSSLALFFFLPQLKQEEIVLLGHLNCHWLTPKSGDCAVCDVSQIVKSCTRSAVGVFANDVSSQCV